MVYSYPKTITTTTGHSTKHGTQQLSNKTALSSNSTALAYWGVKKPTYKGNYLRNYPDSITTPSGSYSKPEAFYATDWDFDDIDDSAVVKKIVVEYKWEQISYSSKTAFGKFDKPTITITHKDKTLTSLKGSKPEAVRYENNTVNKNKQNTNYAELATLHSHTIDLSKYNLTIKDLKNVKIKFTPARNEASNYCRIVMQFIRLNIAYDDSPTAIIENVAYVRPEKEPIKILPVYRVSSQIKEKSYIQGEIWTYECTIKGQNKSFEPTSCTLRFSDDIEIVQIYAEEGSSYDENNKIWTIDSLSQNSRKLVLKCRSYQLETDMPHWISAAINKYADTIGRTTIVYGNVVPDRVELNINLQGEKEPYTFRSLGETISKSFHLSLLRDHNYNPGRIVLTTDNWLNKSHDLILLTGTAKVTYMDKGEWEISNITSKTLDIVTDLKELKPGQYKIKAQYYEANRQTQTQTITINVFGNTMDKEFFKLRLEDGSDVRYNSLMFAPGDDLTIPLTYDIIQDTDLKDHLIVTGEEKAIPVGEARYISFYVELKDTDKIYKNVLAYIDIFNRNEPSENCSEILISADSNIQIFQGEESKFCVIDELKPDEIKKINFVVQSDVEQTCDIKLKPFNYDNNGKSVAYFKDIPNVKLSIQTNKTDMEMNDDDLIVTYTIENKSINTYCIDPNTENNVTGYKFQITEPSSFKIKSFSLENEDTEREYYFAGEDMNDLTAPQFNIKDRIITLPCIRGATYVEETQQLITHPYKLIVHYTPTQKGIYDFKLCTKDNPIFPDDDQYKNCTKKQVLVDIDSNVKVKTFVSKQRPYIDELIDFTVQVHNYTKPQDILTFNIQDIGSYEIDHLQNDYQIEYINCVDSVFTPSDEANNLGTWTITNVDVNAKYELVLTLRPKEIGYHVIKTQMTDSNNNIQDFSNLVNVLERNKKISFDVQHAVDLTGEADCSNCDLLTPICDEDYINLNDELYYIISVTNNSKNPITEATHIYARLPNTFLYDYWLCPNCQTPNYNMDNTVICEHCHKWECYLCRGFTDQDSDGCQNCHTWQCQHTIKEHNQQRICHTINKNHDNECQYRYNEDQKSDNETDAEYESKKIQCKGEKVLPYLTHSSRKCHTMGYGYNEKDGLVSFTIPTLKPCETKKICIRLCPADKGTYISNFMLTNHNAHTYHKQLTIHINDEFNAHKMEHEIIIYNFEKTNRYFRYELDGDSNIFKFFNQGNRPIKYVDAEDYKKSSIEYYKGKNLKELLKDIAQNSKYVEPELLRIGSNKLQDKGYELYPDGFIRRFGLLNSEVFHFAGQFPTVISTVDHAMRWNEDMWDNKVWGGGIYENGVFDLSIDYSKVPTNFDILNIDNPIGKLQALVDKAKPYGTKALCHYNDTIDLQLRTDINVNNSEIQNIIPYQLKMPFNKFDLISLYNRHDNSIAIYYDLLYYMMKNNIDIQTKELYTDTNPFVLSLQETSDVTTDLLTYVHVFDQSFTKKYIHEAFDIVSNMYNINAYSNIDIIKDYQYTHNEYYGSVNANSNMQYTFEYQYNTNEKLIINIEDDQYSIEYSQDPMNNFKGFTVYKNNIEFFTKNIDVNVQTYHIQTDVYKLNDNDYNANIIHLWIHTNDNKYYHLGYIIVDALKNIVLDAQNAIGCEYVSHDKTRTRSLGATINDDELINIDPINFSITNDIYAMNVKPKRLIQTDGKYQWKNMYKFFNDQGYILFQNDIEIDTDCRDSYISSPTLALKYENINIGHYDEVVDINVKIKSTSNKETFLDDLAISLYKDGDYYMPNDNLAVKTYYPNKIANVYEEYVSHINIQQPNITLCSNCLKTTLGYYDHCPYCESDLVSHYNDKKAVTVCYNCGYIVDGWHDYCTHCLSDDIEKTQVDYNKTYCQECGNLEDDYYTHCPKCFSSNVVHLNNDEYKYIIQSDSTQNINPIIIQSDSNRINVCNITLPFNINTAALKQYEHLHLHIHGKNNNDGKFYYCPSCNHVGLGNPEYCEQCGNLATNYHFDNTTMDIYMQINDTYSRLDADTEYDQLSGVFDIAIDIKDLANKNTDTNEFKILLYAEDLLYDQIDYTISKLDIDQKAADFLRKNVVGMDLIVDNIYYDSKYIDTIDWEGIDDFRGINHKGINYTIMSNNKTDYIGFNQFQLDQPRYNQLKLYIEGINKSHSNLILNLMIFDKNENILYNSNVDFENGYKNIDPDLFVYEEDLTKIIEYDQLPLISNIKIAFTKITENIDVTITDCYIVGEFEKYHNSIDMNIDKGKYNFINNNDDCLIQNNNLFGLKQATPGYIDGRQLQNGIVCLLDFGNINAEEYIRLYDVQLLITYKNKYGQLITEAFDNSDDNYTEILVEGTIIKNDGDAWTTIKKSINILNNLEYEIINKDNEDDLSAVPLNKKLSQSFTLMQSNISSVTLNYFGQVGSPNQDIVVELYDDYMNHPDNLICQKYITLPNIYSSIDIDFNIDNLNVGERYWIVLKDDDADEYNYHRFRYNGNINIGHFIHNETYDDSRVLSFGINAYANMYESYTLPMSVEDDLNMVFKTAEQFYRYNTQSMNTTTLQNLSIKLGYKQYNDDENPIIIDDNENYIEDDEYGTDD